ncbi:hypothetical protein AVEN_127860-1 [Araneus ventricosus]|uniref:Uncharacterized protein n=1 Tax=Araneus ventricosus TaxID=182803 RepID=A0A4Y1ZZH7_ARAVE|nr:hypothetical protein AVEN_127860-1 [Araneus ventricosus]
MPKDHPSSTTGVVDKEKFHGPAGSRRGQVGEDVSCNSGMPLSTITVSRHAPQPREEYTMTRTTSEGLIDEKGVTTRGQLSHLGQKRGEIHYVFVDFLRWWLFCDGESFLKQCAIRFRRHLVRQE